MSDSKDSPSLRANSIDKPGDEHLEHVSVAPDVLHKDVNGKIRPRLTPAERKQQLDEALLRDPGVANGSWRAIQTLLIVLVACCCTLLSFSFCFSHIF